ncbi:MAG TPA: hypothetical protein VF244_03855, partial [Acidimicrobiales bacterium]
DEYVAMIAALSANPAAAAAAIAPLFSDMALDRSGAVGSVAVGPADDAALAADPARRERLEAMLAEAFRTGATGLAADIVSYTMIPWGFEVADVQAPVTAFYGADDLVCGPAHGQWYVDQLPHGDLRVVPDVGHLVALTAWADVLSALRGP